MQAEMCLGTCRFGLRRARPIKTMIPFLSTASVSRATEPMSPGRLTACGVGEGSESYLPTLGPTMRGTLGPHMGEVAVASSALSPKEGARGVGGRGQSIG